MRKKSYKFKLDLCYTNAVFEHTYGWWGLLSGTIDGTPMLILPDNENDFSGYSRKDSAKRACFRVADRIGIPRDCIEVLG